MSLRSFVLLSLLAALSAARVAAQLTWSTETVVTGIGFSGDRRAALALGAGGTAGIAYFTGDGMVNYAGRSAGGAWTNDAAIDDRGNFNYAGISVRLTAAGDPRIGYFSVNGLDARYASRTGSTWSTENIATTGNVGEYIHLGLASDGTARVAYGGNSNSLNFASRASGAWVAENITSNGIPAFLRLNGSNVPFVAMVDSQNTGDLRIFSNPTGSSWVSATAVAGFGGNSTTLSFRLNGTDAALSWVDNGALKFARSTGGVWGAPETVVASGVSNNASSLALDGSGNGYIAYETGAGTVHVARYNGSAWVSDSFGSGVLGFGQGETLDFLNGTLGLAYVTGGGDLAYAFASVSAIPEPSTYALCAGLGALGLALWRRTRRIASPEAGTGSGPPTGSGQNK
ncbi:MAG: hypothetical protein B9S34_09020 [Opitutia bacterium Tous-C1TDCM]|nr:MAG: hypothetical protein B9S34_09020 [Opitutae bacterium Tous-C1TDCM]